MDRQAPVASPSRYRLELSTTAFPFRRELSLAPLVAAWEAAERPLTDHTQRVSVLLGLTTTWPPMLRALALKLSVRSKWLLHQRTRIVYHQPTGT